MRAKQFFGITVLDKKVNEVIAIIKKNKYWAN